MIQDQIPGQATLDDLATIRGDLVNIHHTLTDVFARLPSLLTDMTLCEASLVAHERPGSRAVQDVLLAAVGFVRSRQNARFGDYEVTEQKARELEQAVGLLISEARSAS